MQIGIFGRTFPGTDPHGVFQAVKVAGYGAVQHNWASCGLSSIPRYVPSEAIDATRNAAQIHGLTMAAVSGTANLIHPDLAARSQEIEGLLEIIRTAPEIGAPVVTLCTGSRDAADRWQAHTDNDSDEAWRDVISAFERLLPEAEAAGVDLGVEPELANVVNSAQKAQRLIAELGSSRVKIVFDPANLFEVASLDEQRKIIGDALDCLGPHIAMAHAKDRLAHGSFTTAGKGVLDYPFFLEGLKRVGFDGPLITHGLRADEAPQVATTLRGMLI
ncbi:MAG: sugar phosphate isomerase/epimerase family protein [Pseudomonadota bacterium]